MKRQRAPVRANKSDVAHLVSGIGGEDDGEEGEEEEEEEDAEDEGDRPRQVVSDCAARLDCKL